MKPGAGFLIFRKFKDGIKFLGLEGVDSKKILRSGTWDFPKGIIEQNESEWECAVRECFEEAGLIILKSDVVGGPFSDYLLTIYIAESDCDPVISPNPETGMYEHLSWKWLSADEMENDCYKWLKPFVILGRKVLGC